MALLCEVLRYFWRDRSDVFIGATHRNGEATGKLFVLWREGP